MQQTMTDSQLGTAELQRQELQQKIATLSQLHQLGMESAQVESAKAQVRMANIQAAAAQHELDSKQNNEVDPTRVDPASLYGIGVRASLKNGRTVIEPIPPEEDQSTLERVQRGEKAKSLAHPQTELGQMLSAAAATKGGADQQSGGKAAPAQAPDSTISPDVIRQIPVINNAANDPKFNFKSENGDINVFQSPQMSAAIARNLSTVPVESRARARTNLTERATQDPFVFSTLFLQAGWRPSLLPGYLRQSFPGFGVGLGRQIEQELRANPGIDSASLQDKIINDYLKLNH